MKLGQVLVVYLLVSFFIVGLEAICEEPVGNENSYGTVFFVPFPEANSTVLTSAFQYRIYAINPNQGQVQVGVQTSGYLAGYRTLTVPANSSSFVAFNMSFMMRGEGKYKQFVKLNSSNLSFGVHVISTEKMDGFTPLPLSSWDRQYMAVTYCSPVSGQCQIVIMASQDYTQVEVSLPAEDANTLTIRGTPTTSAAPPTLTLTLMAGEVYQLQRKYDLTGTYITSNLPIGVLSGSTYTCVGPGYSAGAFIEWLPPWKTTGTFYVVYQTPLRSGLGDYVRVTGLQDTTTVYISTAYQKIILNKFQYITHHFDAPFLIVESDKPVSVVKFSLSEDSPQHPGHPTMTVIQPMSLSLAGKYFVIPEIKMLTNKNQFIIVIAKASDFPSLKTSGATQTSSLALTGTNLQALTYQVNDGAGNAVLSCSSNGPGFAVYSYINSDNVTVQFPVAFRQAIVNRPCVITASSPGDAVDNDCDGQVDEDACTELTARSHSDCKVITSGQSDIWGKQFTFLVPDHCQSNPTADKIVLYVAGRGNTNITVKTPLDPSMVNISQTLASSDSQVAMDITNTNVKANDSRLFADRTLQLRATDEVSVTLVLACNASGAKSIMAARLHPDDTIGREYFVITLCRQDKCQIQISAVHTNTTVVKIRLRVPGTNPVTFQTKSYYNGDDICVTLNQYESLQLQTDQRDLTGTHIQASKPVSVLSGGRLTKFINSQIDDGLLEQLPPVNTWGDIFLVKQNPKIASISKCGTFPCKDYLKIVTGSGDTEIRVTYASGSFVNHTKAPGDYLELELPADIVQVKASKPVLIMQITNELMNLEVSGSIVTPVRQATQEDRIALPDIVNAERYLIVTTEATNFRTDSLMVNGVSNILNTSSAVNGSYFTALLSSNINFTRLLTSNKQFSFGGHVYIISSSSVTGAGMFPLAHKMEDINRPCVITRGSPGDEIDNDCDGTTDEETCDLYSVAEDNDNDGMYNEDCMAPTASLPPEDFSSAPKSNDSPSSSYDSSTSASSTDTPTSCLSLSPDSLLSFIPATGSSSKLTSEFSKWVPSSVPSLIDLSSYSPMPTSSSIFSPVTVAPQLSSSMTIAPATGPSQFLSTPVLLQTSLSVLIPVNNAATSSPDLTAVTSTQAASVCGCTCPSNFRATSLDSSQIEALTSSIRMELSMDKSDFSATKRKYFSVGDQRPSARTMGYLGVILVAMTFMGIFLLDIGTLVKDSMRLIQFCKGKE